MTDKKPLSLKRKRKPLNLAKKSGLKSTKKPLSLAKKPTIATALISKRSPRLGKKKRIVVNTVSSLAKQKVEKKAKRRAEQRRLALQRNQAQLIAAKTIPKKIPPSEVKAKQLDLLLHERYPAWHDYEPLQLGIEKQLFQLISAEYLPYSKRVVQRVLKRHTQCRQYLNSLLHSSRRVSLKNNAVSDVIDTEKDYAKRRLSKIN